MTDDTVSGSTSVTPANWISVRDVRLDLDPFRPGTPVLLRHATIDVPAPAFRELVAAAAFRAGINASGSLAEDRIELAVNVSLLRVRIAFAASVVGGQLHLTPSGGVPGWLIGQAATLVNRTEGLTMARDGRISVDPAPFLPPGVALPTGITGFTVTPEAIVATLG